MSDESEEKRVQREAFLSKDMLDHWSPILPKTEEERQRMRKQAAEEIDELMNRFKEGSNDNLS